PPREPGRRRGVQQRKDALVRRLRVDRLLARTRLVLQTPKAFIGKAMPPKAGDPRLYTDLLGNRPSAPASRRKQNNSGTLQITLQRPRRAAASLKHLALLRRKPDFSCFGNHPDLESRLTFQEKRVLVFPRPCACSMSTDRRLISTRWRLFSRGSLATASRWREFG